METVTPKSWEISVFLIALLAMMFLFVAPGERRKPRAKEDRGFWRVENSRKLPAGKTDAATRPGEGGTVSVATGV